MGATPTYALPYPEAADPADVPTDMHELATAIEAIPSLAFWSTYDANTIQAAKAIRVTGGGTFTGTVLANSGSAAAILMHTDGAIYFAPNDVAFYRDAGPPVRLTGIGAGLQIANDIFARYGATATHVGIGSMGPSGQPGIAFSPDTSLYRAGGALLKTDGTFRVGGYLDVDFAGGGYKLRFGSGGDTTLYRHGANQLATDGAMRCGGGVFVDVSGGGNRLYFGSAGDASLYRTAAGVVGTDGTLQAGASLWLSSDSGGAYSGVLFGGSQDTHLYRYAANGLATDGFFRANNNVIANQGQAAQVYIGGSTASVVFGSAADTSLYRAAADSLKTDGVLYVGKALVVDAVGAGYKLLFGSAQDTTLYRSAAATLRTDSTLFVGANFSIAGSNGGMTWANDTNLYRPAASKLKTDGALDVGGVVQVLTPNATIANASLLIVNYNSVGLRVAEVGPPDSGGAGYRMLRCTN